jgi:hypothetical protein
MTRMIVNKENQLDAYEKFHIYKAKNRKQGMNEQHVVENNALFDLVIHHD